MLDVSCPGPDLSESVKNDCQGAAYLKVEHKGKNLKVRAKKVVAIGVMEDVKASDLKELPSHQQPTIVPLLKKRNLKKADKQMKKAAKEEEEQEGRSDFLCKVELFGD